METGCKHSPNLHNTHAVFLAVMLNQPHAQT